MGLLRRLASLIVVAAVLSPTTSAFAQAPADAAKASMADGDKAAKSKDWKSAIASYDAANKATPSEPALDALANAYYQAGDLGGAFAAYTEWNDKYGAKATPAKKKNAETRLKELTDKTGGVTITVSEAGAIILVDEKQVGVSPLPGQLRLTAGPHHVKVTKDGFLAFDQSPTVAAGTMTAIDAKLAAANAKSKITVTEKGNHQVHVIIDGIDRGVAPFTGDIEPGAHDVVVRGAGFAAPLQKVVVERDKPLTVDVVAIPTTAPVKIATADNRGSIFIDGALVGEGTFTGELGGGNHELKITREGYDTLTEQLIVSDKDPVNKTYDLKLKSKVTTNEIEVDNDRPEGFYGGFQLFGFATPGGTGNALENQCDRKSEITTLTSCSAGDGLGAGLGGFFGYSWDPVGLELYLGGSYDQRQIQNTWNSAQSTGAITGDPGREEEFTIRRAGGEAAIRIRLTKQWSKIRLTFPFGAGVTYRVMSLQREVRAATSGATDRFTESDSYVSPIIMFDPAVGYRISSGVTVTLGLHLTLEAPATFMNGRENPTTPRGGIHRLGLEGISTPPYELASNVQIFVGPVIGMMFGP